MKIACIILAHQNQEQLVRLLNRLSHPSIDCWVHIDGKCDPQLFSWMSTMENVFEIKPRLNLRWGNYNIVQAMINGLKSSISFKEKYNYFHFMSGMDYPLQSTQLFLNYLQENPGIDFIGNRKLEESQQNIERINRYHFNNLNQPVRKIAEALINKILPQRKCPYSFEIRKGPQWMTLTRESVEYILNFIGKNKSFAKFFHYVLAPDEFFFQTILYNSPLKDKMKNHIFHHIDWSEQSRSPKTFTMQDKEKLLTSELFFARKFDISKDEEILDVLDKRITNTEFFKPNYSSH
jgi:hypothetical protein